MSWSGSAITGNKVAIRLGALLLVLSAHASARADGFAKGTLWSGWFSIGNETPAVGDFNGDDIDDVVTFVKSTQTGTPEGDVYVATSNGATGFNASSLWKGWFSPGAEIVRVGDFNGDGKDDIATFVKSTQTGTPEGDVYVALANSSGMGFGASSLWKGWFALGSETPAIGDVDGDGKDDIISFVKSAQSGVGRSDVWIALSTGGGFGPNTLWQEVFGVGSETVMTGKLNRDGKSDLIDFYRSVYTDSRQGDVYVGLTDARNEVEGPATLADFGFNTLTNDFGKKAIGVRPLLVVLMNDSLDPKAVPWANCTTTNAACRAFYRSLVFGPGYPNIIDYFDESSYGHFTFSETQVVGPYEYPAGASRERHAVVEQAIRAAAADVDLDDFDTNGDLLVASDELTVLIVDNRSVNQGFAEPATTLPFPFSVPGMLPAIQIQGAAVGQQCSFALVGHELSHTLGSFDLYGAHSHSFGLSVAAHQGGADQRLTWHLDPWHKMRLGWQKPRIYSLRETSSSDFMFSPRYTNAELSGSVLLYDPRRGTREYFMLEYRDRDLFSYDKDVPDDGVALWHIQTDSSRKPLDIENEGRAVWTIGDDGVHGGNSLFTSADGAFFPRWADGFWSGVVLHTNRINDSTGEVDWGWQSTVSPNILAAPTVFPRGSAITLEGDFNVTQSGRRVVVYDPLSRDVPGSRREFPLTVASWNADYITVTVPSTTPTGSYRVRIYDDYSEVTYGTWRKVAVQ